MIKEDYVSFETAKLLKEKGFDEICSHIFDKRGEHLYCGDAKLTEISNTDIENPKDWVEKTFSCTCPTLQMAMKWLREKHNLHIITLPYAPIDRPPYHPGEADVVYIAQLFKGIIPIDEIGRSVIKLTNEEACEAAIKYCLENLI